MNSMMPKDHDLTTFISNDCTSYEFFDMNYLKCSNDLAADCTLIETKCGREKRFIQFLFLTRFSICDAEAAEERDPPAANGQFRSAHPADSGALHLPAQVPGEPVPTHGHHSEHDLR